MTDLVTFLLDRISEDQALAEAAIVPAEMHPWGDRSLPTIPAAAWPDEVRGYLGGVMGEHCAQHHPLRVLAVAHWQRELIAQLRTGRREDIGIGQGTAEYLLGILAAPYSSHPLFDPAWETP